MTFQISQRGNEYLKTAQTLLKKDPPLWGRFRVIGIQSGPHG
jgi:hypothetical protein